MDQRIRSDSRCFVLGWTVPPWSGDFDVLINELLDTVDRRIHRTQPLRLPWNVTISCDGKEWSGCIEMAEYDLQKGSQHDTNLNQRHNANRVPQISNNALTEKAKSGKDGRSCWEAFLSDAHDDWCRRGRLRSLLPHVQVADWWVDPMHWWCVYWSQDCKSHTRRLLSRDSIFILLQDVKHPKIQLEHSRGDEMPRSVLCRSHATMGDFGLKSATHYLVEVPPWSYLMHGSRSGFITFAHGTANGSHPFRCMERLADIKSEM